MMQLTFSAPTMQIPWATPKYTATPENITELDDNEIFVFGDNLAFRHGAGAAKLALEKFGAKNGVGRMIVGQSYGIPTKDRTIKNILPLSEIKKEIRYWQSIASNNFRKVFLVTKIGCGLANPYGWGEEAEEMRIAEIAPLFKGSPPNCVFPKEFQKYL